MAHAPAVRSGARLVLPVPERPAASVFHERVHLVRFAISGEVAIRAFCVASWGVKTEPST